MDFNSLKDQVSNLTLYDVKAGVRKLQAGKEITPLAMRSMLIIIPAVMNYTEMEQKVGFEIQGGEKG